MTCYGKCSRLEYKVLIVEELQSRVCREIRVCNKQGYTLDFLRYGCLDQSREEQIIPLQNVKERGRVEGPKPVKSSGLKCWRCHIFIGLVSSHGMSLPVSWFITSTEITSRLILTSPLIISQRTMNISYLSDYNPKTNPEFALVGKSLETVSQSIHRDRWIMTTEQP